MKISEMIFTSKTTVSKYPENQLVSRKPYNGFGIVEEQPVHIDDEQSPDNIGKIDTTEILDRISELGNKVDNMKLSTVSNGPSTTLRTNAEAETMLMQLEHYQNTYFGSTPLNETLCLEFISNISNSVFESATENFGFNAKYDLMNPMLYLYAMCMDDHHNETMGKYLYKLYQLLEENLDFIKQMNSEFDSLDGDVDEAEEEFEDFEEETLPVSDEELILGYETFQAEQMSSFDSEVASENPFHLENDHDMDVEYEEKESERRKNEKKKTKSKKQKKQNGRG